MSELFRAKEMDTERFCVKVSYQASRNLTHIIFSNGGGMTACTFDPVQRRTLVTWLQEIDDAEHRMRSAIFIENDEPAADQRAGRGGSG